MEGIVKREKSIEEFEILTKKLKFLQLPEIGSIYSQEELNVRFLKEQNKNLNAKRLGLIDDVNRLNRNLSTVKKKNDYYCCALTFFFEEICSLLQADSEGESCSPCNCFFNVVKTKYPSLLEKISIEERMDRLENGKDMNIFQNLKDFILYGFNNLIHQKNGVEVCPRHKNFIKTFPYDASEDINSELKSQIYLLKRDYDNEVFRRKEYDHLIDQFKHKVIMMQDRFEEKMSELQKKEQSFKGSNLPIKLSEKENLTKTCENSQSDKKNDNLLRELQEKNKKLEEEYDSIYVNYEQLKQINKQIKETKVYHPEFNAVCSRYDSVLLEKNDLFNKFLYLWDILIHLREEISEQVKNIKFRLQDYISKLVAHTKFAEKQFFDLKGLYYEEKKISQERLESQKLSSQTIEEYQRMIQSLSNEYNFYKECFTSKRKELFMEISNKNKVDIGNDSSLEELRNKSLEQKLMIDQLLVEQELISKETNLTVDSYDEVFEQNLKLTEQINQKQDSYLKICSDIFKLNQTIKIKEEEIVALARVIDVYKSRSETTIDLVALEESVEKIKIEIDERINLLEQKDTESLENLTYKNSVLNSKYASLNEQYEQLIKENSNLMLKIHKLEEKDACKDQKISSLKEKIKKLKYTNSKTFSDSMFVKDHEMVEEELQMYKEQLNCACCNTKQIDAIIIKCFHLFCYDCLKTRYETRQRKCPRCNLNFGQNDFHKIFF